MRNNVVVVVEYLREIIKKVFLKFFIILLGSNIKNCVILFSVLGHAVAQLVEALRLQVGRSRVRFPMVSLEFFSDIILLAALWP